MTAGGCNAATSIHIPGRGGKTLKNTIFVVRIPFFYIFFNPTPSFHPFNCTRLCARPELQLHVQTVAAPPPPCVAPGLGRGGCGQGWRGEKKERERQTRK